MFTAARAAATAFEAKLPRHAAQYSYGRQRCQGATALRVSILFRASGAAGASIQQRWRRQTSSTSARERPMNRFTVLALDLEGTPVSYTHLRAHETPEHLVC